MDLSLSKLQEIVKDREAWHASVHGVTKSWTQLSDKWTGLLSSGSFYKILSLIHQRADREGRRVAILQQLASVLRMSIEGWFTLGLIASLFAVQRTFEYSPAPQFVLFYFFNFTILYWFCHISTWIRHRYTRVPHLEPFSLLPPCTIPLGHPSAPDPSIQYHASNLDCRLVSKLILYMFQCHSPKSSHPLPLPQSPKDCSIHQCLFGCLVHRVIVTIFLNSIYMC